jgi:cell division septum initiation protein DivIVA
VAAPSEFLRRFRFHVVPGAPAAVPAPADRAGELEAEVAPIFAALEEAQRDARAIVADAERDAAAGRARAVEHGQRLIADARAGCAAARAAAAELLLADADRERDRLLADGRAEANRIARVAAERMPALIDDVVRRVLAQAEALPALELGEAAARTVRPGEEPRS